MSFSFEQLIHPQPSLTHVACISARQVAAAAVAATSSTVSTGSTRSTRTTAKPISSQATQPAQPPAQPPPPPAKRCLLASPGRSNLSLIHETLVHFLPHLEKERLPHSLVKALLSLQIRAVIY